MMRKPKVVFFGSGPVAAKSLELLSQDFEIEAVVTKPKPEHHRGNFPVLDVAEQLNLPVKTVTNKAELSELLAQKPFKSPVAVLIDFGIIVAQDVIDYFPKGIVNSHFSLLPEWRGADPITFSILSGQKQTGVSLMLLVEKMDEGPLLGIGVHDIKDGTTTTQLTHDLIHLSDGLLRKMLPSYLSGEPEAETGAVVSPCSQEETCRMRGVEFKPTYSRKLTKEDGRIDWTKTAAQLECEVRAYIEWPKSYTSIGDREVILTSAHVDEPRAKGKEQRAKAGKIFITEDKEISMQTGDGFLVIDKLKPAGKNEMTAKEFIAGYGKDL